MGLRGSGLSTSREMSPQSEGTPTLPGSPARIDPSGPKDVAGALERTGGAEVARC